MNFFKLKALFLKIKFFRGGEIRTPDFFVPNEARYRAALHPDLKRNNFKRVVQVKFVNCFLLRTKIVKYLKNSCTLWILFLICYLWRKKWILYMNILIISL